MPLCGIDRVTMIRVIGEIWFPLARESKKIRTQGKQSKRLLIFFPNQTRVSSGASYLCFLFLNFSFFLLTFTRFEALRGHF